MATSKRLQTIDTQINILQNRKKKLEEKRKNQLTLILNRCGAQKMPDDVLAGAILEATKAFSQNDGRVADWRSAGLKIIKPGRGRQSSL